MITNQVGDMQEQRLGKYIFIKIDNNSRFESAIWIDGKLLKIDNIETEARKLKRDLPLLIQSVNGIEDV